MKKIFALLIAMVMVLGMSTSVFAADDEEPAAETVTITVNRDSSYAGETTDAGRTFTWYKIFTAVPADDFTSSNASGHNNGTANVNAGGGEGVAYYANAAVGTILKGTGNIWFDVQEISGSTDYVVTWKEGVATDAATLQAAAKWLINNNAYEDSGSMTFADGAWTADVEKGYYVLSSDTGDNVIAATTDITVNEKNDYPPITKEQKDEDITTFVDENGDPLDVAIGDVVNYQVTVSIPKAAKVGETIEVWDKPSSGLTYNDDVVATPATDVTDGTVGTGEVWHKIITVTADNKGTDVVFTYSMTINDSALADTGRKNEATLKYGDEYESLPHSVEYTTYFTGIIKTNSDEEPLEGVKFDLFEDGDAFNVILTDAGYYIPAGADVVGATNEVVTDADGLIKIRGLDNDKTYTLTETYTLPGYNMLEEDVTLTLKEDKDTAFADMTADEYQPVVNQSGTVLPSTGGIGTTIFYIIGAILVVGAGVVLVTRRRMNVQ